VGIEVGRLGEITDMNDLIAIAGGDGSAALAAARGEEGGKNAEREGGRGCEAEGGLKGAYEREGGRLRKRKSHARTSRGWK